MSSILVTLAVGTRFSQDWHRLCRPGWEAYAQRHGYELLCLTEALDTSDRARSRSISWQKCLILGHPEVARYDRVIWVDADVLIRPESPAIDAGLAPDAIGGVEAWSAPSPDEFTLALARNFQRWKVEELGLPANTTGRDYYARFGLDDDFDEVLQCGIFTMTPSHRDLFEKVYRDYEDKGGPEWNYEMRPLSYELVRSGKVTWLDPRFNRLWNDLKIVRYPFLIESLKGGMSLGARIRRKILAPLLGLPTRYQIARLCATTAYLESYFLHFAGAAPEMEWVTTSATDWTDCHF